MDKPTPPSNVDPLTWVGPNDDSLPDTGLIHFAHIPPTASKADPVPVVVMLHGWAGDESSMWIFKQTIPKNVAIITPRAPVALNEGEYAWFAYNKKRLDPNIDSLEEAQQMLEDFLDRMAAVYPVDPLNLVLAGFSQGAMMGNHFIINNPDRALGMASLAGAVPAPPQNPQSNQLAGVPVFVAHGVKDDVIPVKYGRLTHRIYAALGADVTYGEYSAAHKLHVDGIKELKRWMARFFPGNNKR